MKGHDPSAPGMLARLAQRLDPHELDAELAARSFERAVLGREVPAPVVGRFELRGRIGAGSFGSVFAAWDPQLGRSVAIKIHDAIGDAALRDRFGREAKALAQISHPHVVEVFGFGASRWGLFIAMELVDGVTLRAWQQSRPWPRVVELYLQLAEALAATHAAGLVHGDVKPDNAVIGHDGRLRLVDFGLVDGAEDDSTQVGAGTPGYAAPELLAGRSADARSDQFSFCVALHEALAGARPFTAPEIAALALRNGRRRRIAGVPRRLARAIERGLAVAPDDRHADMTVLAAELREILDDRRRRPWTIAAGIAAAAIAFAMVPRGRGCRELAEDAAFDEGRTRLVAALRDDGAAAPEVDAVIGAITQARAGWDETRAHVCSATLGPVEILGIERVRSCLHRGDAAVAALVAALTDEPATRSRLPELLDALASPAGCLDDRDGAIDPRTPEVLAAIDRGRLALAAGRPLPALALADDAVDRARALAPGEPLAEALLLRARTLDELERDTEAHESFLEAAQLAEAHALDRLAPGIWFALARMAATDLRSLTEAERFANHGTAARLRLGASPELEVEDAIVRADIAMLRSDLDAAQTHLEHAQVLATGLDNPSLRERIDERVAIVALDRGDLERASASFDAVWRGRAARLGEAHFDTLRSRFEVGLVERARGDWSAANATFSGVLDDTRALHGDSPRAAPILLALAESELALGDVERALVHARDARRLQIGHLPPGDDERGSTLALLAAIHLRRGDHRAALSVNLELIDEIERYGSPSDLSTVYNNVGWLLCELGECQRAGAYYERSSAYARSGLERAAATHGFARVALARGDLAGARSRLEQALDEIATLDDAGVAEEHAEIELHLAELLARSEPGSGRVVELAQSAAARYRELGDHENAAQQALALAERAQ